MAHNAEMFVELDESYTSMVMIGNGDYLDVKGKGIVAVNTPTGTK